MSKEPRRSLLEGAYGYTIAGRIGEAPGGAAADKVLQSAGDGTVGNQLAFLSSEVIGLHLSNIREIGLNAADEYS